MFKALTVIAIAIIATTVGPTDQAAKFFKSSRIETTAEAKTIEHTAAKVTPFKPPENTPQSIPQETPVPTPLPTPIPTPVPTPTPVPVQYATYPTGCELYRPIVAQYDWNVTVAMNVMAAESGCNPMRDNMTDRHYAANGTLICVGSFGLFQISCHSGRIYDPAANIAAAWAKYKGRGWQPWSYTCQKKVQCY